MTVTLRKRRRAARAIADARLLARDDARALALEIGRGTPAQFFDAMGAGIVLRPEETAYRQVATWLYVQESGSWLPPVRVVVLITDERLLCQAPAGAVASLPWSTVVGLRVNLHRENVILDYGDGRPLALSGPTVPPLAVAAVALVYGVEALLTHASLRPLRS